MLKYLSLDTDSFKVVVIWAGILLMGHLAISQEITIHGSVIDGENVEKLIGVHIFSDQSNGTSSDIDGNFHMTANYLDTLKFSMLGYQTVTLVLNDSSDTQSMIISMKKGTIVLKQVDVFDFFQANTILKKPQRAIYRVPGIKYPDSPAGKNYRLGVAGAIFSPMTALNRLIDKDYKQQKRMHTENQERSKDDYLYGKAKIVLYEALESLDETLDEYYMLDFIYFLGMNLESVANRTAYDMVKILPGQLERYYDHLESKEDEDN